MEKGNDATLRGDMKSNLRESLRIEMRITSDLFICLSREKSPDSMRVS